MNKIYLILLLLLSSIGSTFAQGGEDLSPTNFYEQTKNASDDIQIIDVRTAGEFNSGHINNAGNVDFNDRKFTQEISTYDKNKPTYIYCLSGGRSKQAMQIMLNEGFTKVYNLNGGMTAWRAAKLPVAGDQSAKAGMTMEEFDKLVDQDVPVLVDFTATWCGPCKLMKPSLVKLSKNYTKKVKVVYIDVDKNKALVNKIGIQAMPTLHFYKKGRLVRKKVGLRSYQELVRFIR